VRQIDRKIIPTRESADATNMVRVLVCHDDGGDLGGFLLEPGETFFGQSQRKSTIEQNNGIACTNEGRVTLAAATQKSERQSLFCGCERRWQW